MTLLSALKAFYRAWLRIAHFIGKVNTMILLTLFYLVIVGITRGVVFLLRKDLLDERWRDRTSYWKRRTDFKREPEQYLKPY